MKDTAIYWFTNDLRLQDNTLLRQAASSHNRLLCVFFVEPAWFQLSRFQSPRIAKHRYRFLIETLQQLDQSLRKHGQFLHLVYDSPERILPSLIDACEAKTVYASETAGYDETIRWRRLKQDNPNLHWVTEHTHTLFCRDQLPFDFTSFPDSFSKFRRMVEKSIQQEDLLEKRIDRLPNITGGTLPVSPLTPVNWIDYLPQPITGGHPQFEGGELNAQQHLKRYFSDDKAKHYKDTRNHMDEWEYSTKFSPWLANGSLSPLRVVQELRQYESSHGANESTSWILFELLWREYFQWYAHRWGNRLFRFSGIQNRKPLTSYYGERFQQWCHGSTPYPIVNACMKQLNATGYMSNRGRQLAASCFVHELQLDWRYGAAYFEQQLIDYDVAANWGNWQYLAGVGADPRGHRKFDLQKQTKRYDPDFAFIKAWQGDKDCGLLDSVDAADWPISS